MAESYKVGNDAFARNNNATKVNIVSIENRALNSIVAAINRQSNQIKELATENKSLQHGLSSLQRSSDENSDSTTNAIDSMRSDNSRDRKSELVRSLESERRQRAATNAVHGKLDKGFSLLGTLKTALENVFRKLFDMVSDNFKKSISSFQSFSAVMRQKNLTRDQKDAIQKFVTETQGLLKKDTGIKAVGNEINSYFSELMNDFSMRVEDLDDTQRMLYVAFRKRNVSAEKAYMAAISGNKSLISTAKSMSDFTVADRVNSMLDKFTDEEIQTMSERAGGFDKFMEELTIQQRGMAENRLWLNKEASAAIGKVSLQLQHGILDGINNQDLKALMSFAGTTDPSRLTPEKLAAAFREAIKSGDQEKITLMNRILSGGNPEISKPISDSVALAQQFIRSGRSDQLQVAIRSDEENRLADEQNTPGGRLNFFMDEITRGLLGDVVGPFSNLVDEFFGEDASLESIVSKGLTSIITLLTTITLSDVIKKGLSSLGSLLGIGGGGAVGAGLLTKAKNFFGIGKTAQATEAVAAAGRTAQVAQAANTTANVGRGAKFLKAFGGKAGVAGAAISLLAAGATIYAVNSAPDTTISSESSSERFKEKEKENQSSIKTAKTVGAITEAGFTVGGIAAGAAAGAKFGAVLGSVVPGAGTIIGAAVGTAIGATGGVLVGNITDAYERAKNTTIAIENVADLRDQLKDLDALIAAEGDQDTARKKELLEIRAQVLLDLEAATKHNISNLVANFNAHNEDFANGNADAMSQIAASIEQKTKRLKELEERGKTSTLSKNEKNEIEALNASLRDSRQALTGLAGGEFTLEEGESLDEAIKRIAADVRGDGILDTREDVEYFAAENMDKVNEFLKQQAIDKLTSGVFHDSLDDLEKQDVESIEKFIHESKLDAGLSRKAVEELTAEVMKLLDKEDDYTKWQQEHARNEDKREEELRKLAENNLRSRNESIDENSIAREIARLKPDVTKRYANGGIVSAATLATIGEAGKEVVLPLTRPSQLRNILSSLTSKEKIDVFKALMSNSDSTNTLSIMFSVLKAKASGLFGNLFGNTTGDLNNSQNAQVNIPSSAQGYVPGDDPATLNRILDFAGPYRALVYERLLHGWKGNVKDGFKQRKKWYDEAIRNAANQEGRELIRGTYAERALEYGVSELGKPYILRSLGKIGYVCNELVNAAIKASGFDMGKFRVNGVRATFANIQKGKMSGENYPNFRIRDDLTPQTAIPGMVFFQDARKNKEGGFMPGHIGLVYYGHQKLHAAGGSSNYTKEGFLPNWQTPCRGVTVTPFDGSSYVIGEFPGLFEQATGEWKPPANSPTSFGPTNVSDIASSKNIYDLVNKEDIPSNPEEAASTLSNVINKAKNMGKEFSQAVVQKNLAKQALKTVSEMSDSANKKLSQEYEKYASALLSGSNIKDILMALASIVENTREMASSSRKPIMSVSRPANASFK